VHQLKDVGLRISPPSDLDPVGDVAVALFEPGRVASVYLEHLRLRRQLARAVGILDSKMRLASQLARSAD
jgi:hypothetical protein